MGVFDAEGEARYAAWIRRYFGERARALGWLPQRGEAAEVQRLREDALPFVAVRGQDAALSRKVQQLAQRWLEHRGAIPPSSRRTLLVAAARTAGKDAPALFDALIGDRANEQGCQRARGRARRAGRVSRSASCLRGRSPSGSRAATAGRATSGLLRARRSKTTGTRFADARRGLRPTPMRWPWSPRAETQNFWPVWADGACTQRERARFVEVFEQRSAGRSTPARDATGSRIEKHRCAAWRCAARNSASWPAFVVRRE